MVENAVRACARCHKRKIKCSGFPRCRACNDVDAACEPHTRRRKEHLTQSLKDAEDRIQWLEEIVDREIGVNCHRLPTGTPTFSRAQENMALSPIAAQSVPPAAAQTDPCDVGTTEPVPDSLGESGHAEASDISLLALNATGGQRYLGPSSGSFFASYAASILRSCAPGEAHVYSEQAGVWTTTEPSSHSPEDQLPLQPETVKLLQRSYEMWINPLYPLISLQKLSDLTSRCANFQADHTEAPAASSQNAGEMTLFYLIMALGATNRARTLSQLRPDYISANFPDSMAATPSSTYLYSLAMKCFQTLAQDLQPSVSVIQMLLLVCIYSSHSPLGPSQWQLAGFAMRSAVEIGLHHSKADRSKLGQDTDERNRVFWTAYAIEITIAYNLGRPPSISDEHITADLPFHAAETTLAIQHVNHRRIQGRIISQVYCGTPQATTSEEREALIARLQTELDDWRVAISVLCSPGNDSPYPRSYWDRLYHGTSFVLHRKSPLCPTPPPSSLERCIRAAGAYIDNVHDILKNSDVPTSWMLVQGVLFAGLTMLVTSRTGFMQIPRQKSLPLLLVDFPAWTRRCAVCLAVMNERWTHALVTKLAAQFEVLADSTLRMISTALLSAPVDASGEGTQGSGELGSIPRIEGSSFGDLSAVSQEPVPQFMETYDSFTELFAPNGTSSFWEFPSQDMDFDLLAQMGGSNDDMTFHFSPAGQMNGW